MRFYCLCWEIESPYKQSCKSLKGLLVIFPYTMGSQWGIRKIYRNRKDKCRCLGCGSKHNCQNIWVIVTNNNVQMISHKFGHNRFPFMDTLDWYFMNSFKNASPPPQMPMQIRFSNVSIVILHCPCSTILITECKTHAIELL